MKRGKVFSLLLFVAAFVPLHAQQDSIDALHYNLRLDMGNHTSRRIEGCATVQVRLLRAVDSIGLELCPSDVDSVLVDGIAADFRYDASLMKLQVIHHGNADDTLSVSVFYRKGEYIMAEGWGGFYFDNNIYYNLGIAIYEYPHNVGKAWYPCRDNFYDRASYSFEITAKPGWKAICSGISDSVKYHDDGSSTWYWTLEHQTPTYLVGVAVAPFHIIERNYVGEYATYPALLGFIGHDSVGVWNAFDNMSKVVPMFERCFGPYRWDRVGYVSTPKGSMEHASNISFTTYCMSSNQEACLATMSHEFAHAWFGNLVTCANTEDMWINEGGASFCEEVAIQVLSADTTPLYYRTYARRNLKNVLLNAHVNDGGFNPVYGPTHDNTYGSTVYRKGATVWHSLRGYLGDSLFYATMRTFFDRFAFQNFDSWQLRDTLSSISGVNLNDFFDFHVFNAGFCDFVIDSLSTEGNNATVYLRQKNYGTQTLANGNRVWVTFFSEDMLQTKRMVTFDGATGSASFHLPFSPKFAIVDYDEELSMASVAQHFSANAKGSVVLDEAMFTTNVTKVTAGDSIWLHVSHHWTRPDTSLSPRFIKMADRYWQVTGVIPETCRADGRFYYSRTGSDRTLDNDFISNASEFENVRLLYRKGAGYEWQVATGLHTGSSSNGYFVMQNLKTGEYTLAVIDPDYVGLDMVESTENSSMLKVYPNPSVGRITIETPVKGERLTVDVYDTSGRQVRGGIEARSGRRFQLTLNDGNYLLVVRSVERAETYSTKIQIKNF